MDGEKISIFDSDLFSGIFTQPKLKKIWSDKYLIKCWLDFEKAVAQAQSELSIIPKEAVSSIKEACDTLFIDWETLSKDVISVGMPIQPLLNQIVQNGDDNVRKYLHWGCTTQDLLDTALALRLKETLHYIHNQLITLGEWLSKLAIEHQQTVMTARTNAIDASVTTFGLQISGYLNEVSRHIYRLQQLYPRVCVILFGGAVGNLASSIHGIKVRTKLARLLKLYEAKGFNNASMDNFVEVVQFFSLIHGTLCRIANDIELMSRTSINEAYVQTTGGQSSTMPHKRNPRTCNQIQTLSRMGWMYAAAAPNMLDQQDVRAASMRSLSWNIIPESVLSITTSLENAIFLVKNLNVNKESMLSHLADSNYFILSEAAMMQLAKKIGRKKSYEIIKKITRLDNHLNFKERIMRDKYIRDYLTNEDIINLFNPYNYLGENDTLINESIHYFNTVKLINIGV